MTEHKPKEKLKGELVLLEIQSLLLELEAGIMKLHGTAHAQEMDFVREDCGHCGTSPVWT